MEIDVKIPKRAECVMEDPSRDISVIAHRRWYKTRLGIDKCMLGNRAGHKGAVKDPGTNFFIVLPTYKQAKMVAWDILKGRSKPFGAKANESDLTVTFFNGSKISLKGSDKPDSLRGPGLDGRVLDEWAFHDKPEVSTKILRPALADCKGWSLKTTTLDGENHAWDDHKAAESSYMFKASETGVLSKEELDLMRKEMPEDEYLQEMECIPLHLAGSIYKEFDEKVHVVKPFEIDPRCNFIVGLDWGISHKTAILFCAVDFYGNFIVYDELVDHDKPVDYYAPQIMKKMGGKQYLFPISPDTLKRDKFRDGVRYSVFQEFVEQGMDPTIANNSVHAGINKIKQLLILDKIKIFDHCTELIAGMKRYKWKADVDEPAKVVDDEVDGLRYAVATYFETPVIKVPKPVAKEGTLEYHREILNRQNGVKRKRKVKQYANFR
ncbi:MAG: terminase family protein [Candidatus Margulisiibacteriota bacterium]|nr:terminase family protein [Candidatus Margulisiibacteriota bacterium]